MPLEAAERARFLDRLSRFGLGDFTKPLFARPGEGRNGK
jgi:hypothetical protein